jgi:pSer/pThr/pTyr-binding forkhead associated (FHA) protein
MIVLQVALAGGESFERSFDKDSIVIGRSSKCDLFLADSSLSREHARIFQDGEAWFVEDLGARNGTLFGKERISGPRALARKMNLPYEAVK